MARGVDSPRRHEKADDEDVNGQDPREPPASGAARHLLEDAFAQRLEASALMRDSRVPTLPHGIGCIVKASFQQIPCARASRRKGPCFRERFRVRAVSTSRQMLRATYGRRPTSASSPPEPGRRRRPGRASAIRDPAARAQRPGKAGPSPAPPRLQPLGGARDLAARHRRPGTMPGCAVPAASSYVTPGSPACVPRPAGPGRAADSRCRSGGAASFAACCAAPTMREPHASKRE